MFTHNESKKKGGFLPFTILRLFLSVIILSIFAFGAYEAFKYFSGVDPLKLYPQGIIISLFRSEEFNKTIHTVFNNNPPKKILELKNQLTKDDKKESDNLPQGEGKLILRFAVVADSHNYNDNLKKSLKQSLDQGAKFVIGLGDYTNVGSLEELEFTKKAFNSVNLPFYLTAGDHDLWASRDKGFTPSLYFNQVFGSAYQSFSDSNIRFIIVYNSDNYEGVDFIQMEWLKEELKKSREGLKFTFVFLHEPIFHPSSDRVMGSPRKAGEVKTKIQSQAEELRALFKEASVLEVFAGDIHSFTRYKDPQFNLSMTTIGALTGERNTQTPRFAIVDVFDNGSYNVEDVEIK